MKKIMILGLILLLSVPALAAGKGTHIHVTVNGLVCDFCAVSMKKIFMKKDPVAAVNVNLTTKIVDIDLKPGKALDDAEIKKGITDAGYAVVSIKRD
jgi:copper chaperone CopZ